MDADEDVTLEGSPLDAYLKNLEDDSFADEKILNSYDQSLENKTICKHGFLYGVTVQEYVRYLWKTLRTQVSCFFPVSEDVILRMSHFYHEKYGESILQSSVVLEDDLDYLCLKTPRQFLGLVKPSALGDNIFNQAYISNSTRCVAMMVALVSCLVLYIFSDFLPMSAQMFFGICIVFILLFNIRLQIVIELWRWQHETNLNILKQFLTTSEKLHKVVRKSISLIKEMEVVLHGYKLVNGRTPITRIEEARRSSNRSFVKLRCAVVRSTMQCISSCRKSALRLLDYKQLEESLNDTKQVYLCQIPLHEFWKSLDDSASPFQMNKETKDYSLSTLKQLNDLLYRQRSEMLTQLSLALSSTTWDFTKDGFLCNLSRILREPSEISAECYKFLQCCYEMHKYYVASSTKQDTASRGKSKCKTSALTLNLHSMQVHLRAAMYATMQLEVDLDKDRKLSPGQLDVVKMHLDSCCDCWEESSKQVALVNGKSTDEDERRDVELAKARVVWRSNNDPDKIATLPVEEETDFSDQIFEAVAEDREDGDVSFDSNLDDDADNKLLAESATVMKELRSVLAVKTCEQQRESWKKQLFPTFVPKARANKDEPLASPADGADEREDEDSASTATTRLESRTSDCKPILPDCDAQADNKGEPLPAVPLANGTSDRCRLNGLSSISEECNGNTESALPSGAESNLKVFKRAQSVGRLPTRRQRQKTFQQPVVEYEQPLVPVTLTNGPLEGHRPDWAAGLGLGFSNTLAAQAALLAKQRSNGSAFLACGPAETLTYGSDSDDNDASC